MCETQNRAIVRTLTERAAKQLDNGEGITPIFNDENAAPHGTTDYEGRALAFHVTVAGRDIRVTVEDVTLDD